MGGDPPPTEFLSSPTFHKKAFHFEIIKRKADQLISRDRMTVTSSFKLYKICRVVVDEEAGLEGDIRVIDESGEDYLYPSTCLITP